MNKTADELFDELFNEIASRDPEETKRKEEEHKLKRQQEIEAYNKRFELYTYNQLILEKTGRR